MKLVNPAVFENISEDDPKSEFSELFLNSQMCFDIYAAATKFNRVYAAALERFDLTLPQLLVLMALWEKSPMYVGDVSRALDLDAGAVTPILKRLESNGFVTRTRDTRDERKVSVHITEKSLSIQEPMMEMKRGLACALDLSADEIEEYRSCLQQIARKFDRSLQ